MLDGLVILPKTRAGQHFKELDVTVIRERLTSYGSQAFVKLDNNEVIDYIVVYYDQFEDMILFINCHHNIRLAQSMWCEIV